MKAITILSIYFAFTFNHAASQPIHVDGGKYLKTVEYNVIEAGLTEESNIYNLEHKSTFERIFFGLKNSFVEFTFEDSPEESNEALAFRIIKKQQGNSYELEVMHLKNVQDVYGKMRNVLLEKATPIATPFWLSTAVSREIEDKIKDHNKQVAMLKDKDDLYKPYHPEPLIFQVSNEFAEKLHEKTSSLIDNFKGEGIAPNIFDGSRVTFRCVVDDEVWALSIHMPQGKALRLSNLYRRMIKDRFNNNINEYEYLQLLDEIV